MSQIISHKIDLGGRQLILESGRFAGQADQSILARYGDTMVLATVVSSQPKADLDYFPLSVEYVERLYAGGRIKGSRFIKREGRPSDEAILAGRLIDRSIRPLFPKDYYNEVQVVITVLSVDSENSPEILSAVAASAAVACSSIPWDGPIGTIEVGYKDGTYFINPTNGERDYSELILTVSGTRDKAVMLEASAKEIADETILGGIAYGLGEIQKIIDLIEKLASDSGKQKQLVVSRGVDPDIKREILKVFGDNLPDLVRRLSSKEMAASELEEVKAAVAENLSDEKKKEVGFTLEQVIREQIRNGILEGIRPDGRKIDQIREITCDTGLLPRTHGSAVFQRGETQVLTVTTLGAPSLGQLIESPEGEETKRFIHHYSMPPFSTGETGRVGTPSRREIGHGALAEKSLVPVVPSEDQFPYTIRLVSEVMSSNGSTSMASTCASSLSLMDAGVPITSPVAGLALGLVEDGKKYTVLSDIIGLEDHYGDMDFKIAGTAKGITAIQLDVKNNGLNEKVLKEAIERAKTGRQFILEKMVCVLGEPRVKLSQYAPKVSVLHIAPEKIGEVIGPGGRMIRKITEKTGAAIDIEDDGTVNISGTSDGVEDAVKFIEGLTHEVKAGEIYEGEVKRIQPFGAFVEVLPGKEGLVHVSQMAREFVSDPGEIVQIGQKVKVRVAEIDSQGRINLSMRFGEDEEPQLPARSPRRRDFSFEKRRFTPRTTNRKRFR